MIENLTGRRMICIIFTSTRNCGGSQNGGRRLKNKYDAECAGCRYYRPLSATHPGPKCCHYGQITGQCRIKICPPGKKCTVRVDE